MYLCIFTRLYVGVLAFHNLVAPMLMENHMDIMDSSKNMEDGLSKSEAGSILWNAHSKIWNP